MSGDIIESKNIVVFVKLSETLSMRKAGEDLHLTPSAISHSLKCLEIDLDCKLFDRSSRSMALTDAGRRFLPDAKRILEVMRVARERTNSPDHWQRGQLKIGAGPSACQYILPAVIREFQESFPKVSLKIDTIDGNEAEEKIKNNELDLALVNHRPASTSLEFVEIGEDELCFIVNPLHRWATSAFYGISDLHSERLIYSDAEGYYHDRISEYFRPHNLNLRPFIEVGHEEIIKHFVRLNLGIGIIAPWIASSEIEERLLVSVAFGTTVPKRQWGIIYSKNKELTFPEHLFLGSASYICKNLMQKNP
ncbi:LysR family transcriptional regulator [Rubellicoccus peritrichatus]|uniref:LysR family transcriptional regulator n=1 Tax=Rubellicoccus peritrichatus TaxID=3080537 RepID=A0AAQ3LB34_9BACT|nr:LysR family transcriptional regulator [Puniceicoccus sp. CR14]WOO40228.1 LysR family transcriptional regulator [Puniceicoccus sp. CR14]